MFKYPGVLFVSDESTGDESTGWGLVRSNEGVGPIHHSEEGAEPKGDVFHYLVNMFQLSPVDTRYKS